MLCPCSKQSGVVIFRGTDDDIDNIEKRAKKLIIHKSVKDVPEGINVAGFQSSPFACCTTIEELVIEKGVETIGKNSFRDCWKLKMVSFPSTLKVIDEWAFVNCKSLTLLIIPPSVERIEKRAFFQCENLIGVNIIYKGTKVHKDFFFKGMWFASFNHVRK